MVAKNHSGRDYLKYANHGFPFLQKMWDTKCSGFYQTVNRSGKPIRINGFKTAYGNAFAIYGLSAYYEVSGDTAALDLAKKTFLWLEQHSHDPVEGGYFQSLTREGAVIMRNDSTPAISPIGYKDYNSSIHLLEAITSLYKVWPDPLVKERLSEMYHLVKDVMINDRHYLDLFFKPDWEPISFYKQDSATIIQNAWMDHVSFGHDIETAYLLLEAAEALELANDGLMDELRSIVDHALKGWDNERGGIYDQGYYFDRDKPLVIIRDSKEWWAQAEALNTLLIFHHYYPDAGYGDLFVKQWNYIKKYVIDPVNGGWYTYGIDTRPQAKNFPKASEWKTTYHNYRALSNCLNRLKEGIF
jgi:mannobiose 2-epimerase